MSNTAATTHIKVGHTQHPPINPIYNIIHESYRRRRRRRVRRPMMNDVKVAPPLKYVGDELVFQMDDC